MENAVPIVCENDEVPIVCLYCQEPIPVGVPFVWMTQTELGEDGEPDLGNQRFVAAAHPGCWDRAQSLLVW